MPAKLRVGIVDFLNSKPLGWAFHRGVLDRDFEPRYHRPATVARLMAQGELDVGLLPSIEVPRLGNLSILPELCVSSDHEVRSVILVSRRDLSEVRRVALDTSSRTSAALVRILFRDLWSGDPEFLPHSPDLSAMLDVADAALLIGDPALHVDAEQYRVHDLAAAWKSLTGLPFVFAVWAVAEGVSDPRLAEPFHQSLALARQEFDLLVKESAAELSLEEAEVRSYLSHNLSFELGTREKAGLEEFYRRAYQYGLLPNPPEIRWFNPAVSALV